MNAAAHRERMNAAAREIDKFYNEHKDADGNLPSEHDEALAALNATFQQESDAFQRASAAEGTVLRARDVLSMAHQAVKGTPVNWSQVVTAMPRRGGGTLGAQFVESAAYRKLAESGALTSSAKIGLSDRFQAASSDIIHTEPPDGDSPGPAGALVTPTYLPDVVPLGRQPLRIRDLFTNDTAPDAPIIDARQTARDKGTVGTAQATSASGSGASGGVKQQSSLAWEAFPTYPQTIATWMATTRQALSQANRVRTLIDTEGAYMIALKEEDLLLNGTGLNGQIAGLLSAGVDFQELDADTLSDRRYPNLVALRKAMTMIAIGDAKVPADAIAIHPNDAMEMDILTDEMGRFLAGDPFGTSAPGGPTALWRLPRVESESIDEGTCIVGAWKLGGTVYDVVPTVIYTSDSHEDFFVRNLIAILFEERIALVVRRPAAFVNVTFTDWVSGS
jgi:HK97 family phage major capsid protein